MRKDIEARSLIAAFLFDPDNGRQLSPLERPTNREITEATGYKFRKVTEVIDSFRSEGIVRRPTKEEEFVARSKAYKGHPSYFRGTHSLEFIIRTRERNLGRPLTELEREYAHLFIGARRVVRDRSRPSLRELYQKEGRNSPRDAKGAFLQLLYAAKICAENGVLDQDSEAKRPHVALEDVVNVYRRLDPGSFLRWRKDVAFLGMQDVLRNPFVEEFSDLLRRARELPVKLGAPSINKLYKKHKRHLPKDAEKDLLQLLYAVKLSIKAQHPEHRHKGVSPIQIEEVDKFYGDNEGLRRSIRHEIDFLRNNVSVMAKNAVVFQE